jgi:PAS domain S-box-containing protein
VPFSVSGEEHRLVERVRALREDYVAAYGVAVVAVSLATLLRWLIGGLLPGAVPFITYYPAVIIATLVGGLGPGIVATVLSAATARFLFQPPVYSWGLEPETGFALLVFLFISAVNITILRVLDAAVARIMDQEKNVRALVESTPNGVLVIDDGGRITLINGSMEELFGYKSAELLGRKVEVLVPDRLRGMHRGLRESFMLRPETRAMGVGRDLSGKRKDGSEFPVEIGLNAVERNGKRAVLATVVDISERKRAEEHQQLLIRELQHRTSNLFSVVQSIAKLTLVEGKGVTEITQEFDGRLHALARTYAVLAEGKWTGARLARIIEQELAPFADRVHVSGCDIDVHAAAAQQFALIVHELATNAIKHGALSTPAGSVSVEGNTERLDGVGRFSFVWTESGGPAVSPPTRKGFGSVILLDSARQFAQTVAMDHARDGLVYRLQAHLADIESQVVAPILAAGETSPKPRQASVDPGATGRVAPTVLQQRSARR